MEVRAWFRQEGEPQRAYEAFCWYVYLPSESRSIEEAYKAAHPQQKSVKRASGRWYEYSSKYNWVSRAQEYDDHLSARQFFMQEEAVRKFAEERTKRAETLERREYEMSQRLFELADRMLKHPINKVTLEKAGQEVHVHPVNWTLATVPRLVEVGDKLGRLSAGLPSDVRSVDVVGTLNSITDSLLESVLEVLGREAYDRLNAAYQAKRQT